MQLNAIDLQVGTKAFSILNDVKCDPSWCAARMIKDKENLFNISTENEIRLKRQHISSTPAAQLPDWHELLLRYAASDDDALKLDHQRLRHMRHPSASFFSAVNVYRVLRARARTTLLTPTDVDDDALWLQSCDAVHDL